MFDPINFFKIKKKRVKKVDILVILYRESNKIERGDTMIACMTLIDEPNNKEIFTQMYYKYRNLMFSIAYDILKDEYDAEDAVSDAFLEIAKNFGKISESCKNYGAYFTMSVKNKAITLYNKKNKIKTTSLENTNDIPIDNFLEKFDDWDIKEKIAALDPKYKYTFYMYYIEGRTVKDMAKILGVSTSCIYKYINNGKRQLIEMLNETGVNKSE